MVDVFTAVSCLVFVPTRSVLERFWHCFQHFFASWVSPSPSLCLSLSFKPTPSGSVSYSRLHSFCSCLYAWNSPSFLSYSNSCQVLLSSFFCNATLFWAALHFFWSLHNAAACAAAIPPVSHAQSYLCTVFSSYPRQCVNEVGCYDYIKDTITYTYVEQRDVEQIHTQLNNSASGWMK